SSLVRTRISAACDRRESAIGVDISIHRGVNTAAFFKNRTMKAGVGMIRRNRVTQVIAMFACAGAVITQIGCGRSGGGGGGGGNGNGTPTPVVTAPPTQAVVVSGGGNIGDI